MEKIIFLKMSHLDVIYLNKIISDSIIGRKIEKLEEQEPAIKEWYGLDVESDHIFKIDKIDFKNYIFKKKSVKSLDETESVINFVSWSKEFLKFIQNYIILLKTTKLYKRF